MPLLKQIRRILDNMKNTVNTKTQMVEGSRLAGNDPGRAPCPARYQFPCSCSANALSPLSTSSFFIKCTFLVIIQYLIYICNTNDWHCNSWGDKKVKLPNMSTNDNVHKWNRTKGHKPDKGTQTKQRHRYIAFNIPSQLRGGKWTSGPSSRWGMFFFTDYLFTAPLFDFVRIPH